MPSFRGSVTLDGTDGRALPPEYGKWNLVYCRYAAWCNQGVWPRLLIHLQAKPDVSAVLLDSTIVRAHVSAPKERGGSRAGPQPGQLGTQIHILADCRGRTRHLRVTGGQRHDSTQARALVEDWIDGLIADRAYDSDGFRAWLAPRDIEAILPARRGRTNPQPHAPERYKARNAVARGIDGLKQWCRVATCYDQYAPRFLGFCTWRWLGSG